MAEQASFSPVLILQLDLYSFNASVRLFKLSDFIIFCSKVEHCPEVSASLFFTDNMYPFLSFESKNLGMVPESSVKISLISFLSLDNTSNML